MQKCFIYSTTYNYVDGAYSNKITALTLFNFFETTFNVGNLLEAEKTRIFLKQIFNDLFKQKIKQ